MRLRLTPAFHPFSWRVPRAGGAVRGQAFLRRVPRGERGVFLVQRRRETLPSCRSRNFVLEVSSGRESTKSRCHRPSRFTKPLVQTLSLIQISTRGRKPRKETKQNAWCTARSGLSLPLGISIARDVPGRDARAHRCRRIDCVAVTASRNASGEGSASL